MIQKTLENLGLNKKEAKIYLSTLELGSSPVSAIASKAKINRVTSYDILEKLVKKGLVNFIIKRAIKYFTATDPELLAEEFKKRANDFHNALPELKRLRGEIKNPKVRYYEGIEGIKSIYADTLTSKTEILNYCNSREIRSFWPEYDREYVKERVIRNIHLRGIALDDELGRQVHAHDAAALRQIRLVAAEKYHFTNEIHIYDDKIAIISFNNDVIGMIIESGDIADTQRAIFEMVWNFSAPMSAPFSAAGATPEMTIRKVGTIKKTEKTANDESQVSLF